MATTIVESIKRNSTLDGRNSSHQRTYRVSGVSSEAAALALAAVIRPAFVTHPSGVELHHFIPKTTEVSYQVYDVTYDWSHTDSPRAEQAGQDLMNPGESKKSFSFSTRNDTVTEAFAQTKYGTNSPDMGTSIRVNEKNVPEGTERGADTSGTITFSKVFDEMTVTNAWIGERAKACVAGKTNDAVFYGFAIAELSFRSFTGNQRASGNWEVEMSFAVSEDMPASAPAADRTVAGIVATAGWQGHDYVWVRYEDSEDTTNKRLVPTAVGLYIAEIYETHDYDTLGI